MERLIAIIGPTAVGKTRLSIDLAQLLDTEIISGDSMLVYRGLDIGTAKPTLEERAGVVHHLIDILPPTGEYSVADFQAQARELITAINRKGKIPILAGGTGLYVKALLEDYQFSPFAGDETLRAHYGALADQYGNQYLYNLLQQLAPNIAARLHPNDRRRVIRALEVHHLSAGNADILASPAGPPRLVYDAAVIGLIMERKLLYERINQRVDTMIANGLVEEVAQLLAEGVPKTAQSLQGIGYKEIVAYLEGETDLPTAIERVKEATRNFAKRQLTWFRKMPYIKWVDIASFPDHKAILSFIYNYIAGKFCLK